MNLKPWNKAEAAPVRPVAEIVARDIRKLERWHRVWEINNRERLITPTFASDDDVTHEHDWTFVETYTKYSSLVDQCGICHVHRKHVPGTLSPMAKLHETLWDLR